MDRKHPVIIVRERDLPIFFSVVGDRKRMAVYRASSDENDGIVLARCKNGKKH